MREKNQGEGLKSRMLTSQINLWPNLKKFLLLNIYNEKSLQENSSEYTVERALNQIKSTQRTLLCEDLNAHHS